MDNIQIIEDFLASQPTEEQQNGFLKQYEGNSELQEDFELVKEINASLREKDFYNLQTKIQELNPAKKTSYSNTIRLISRISIAAILLISFSLVWRIITPQTTQQLYSEYYSPYDANITLRSFESSSTGIQYAYQLYAQKNYQEAFSILDNYLKKNYSDQTARFYMGVCALELKKNQEAIDLLSEVVEDGKTPFLTHAKWYLAMAYLKTDQTQLAAPLLIEIASYNTPNYSNKANKILNSAAFSN